MNKLKRNDTVKIFQKPLTDEKLEGEARLLHHFEDEDDPEIGERWTVAFFTGDPTPVDRWVNERNRVHN